MVRFYVFVFLTENTGWRMRLHSGERGRRKEGCGEEGGIVDGGMGGRSRRK